MGLTFSQCAIGISKRLDGLAVFRDGVFGWVRSSLGNEILEGLDLASAGEHWRGNAELAVAQSDIDAAIEGAAVGQEVREQIAVLIEDADLGRKIPLRPCDDFFDSVIIQVALDDTRAAKIARSVGHATRLAGQASRSCLRGRRNDTVQRGDIK